MSLTSARAILSGVHPEVERAALVSVAWADFFGIPVKVTSGFRSLAEQARLRSRWETGKNPFPAARPGDSAHNFGLAWDSTVAPADLPDWTIIREWMGFRVPGNDIVHAEVPGWRELLGR